MVKTKTYTVRLPVEDSAAIEEMKNLYPDLTTSDLITRIIQAGIINSYNDSPMFIREDFE